MIIDKERYKLPTDNYYFNRSLKKQIVIGNTFSNNMLHYNGWLTRFNGSYKKTATFTITKQGRIYQHFDPYNYSWFIDHESFNKSIISIVLENQGWLILKDDKYYSWVNNEYNDEVIDIKWRNKQYWCGYSDEQIYSLSKVCRYLSKEFNIPLETTCTNTLLSSIYEYEGISFRGNFNKNNRDLSPAFDYNKFKNILSNG